MQHGFGHVSFTEESDSDSLDLKAMELDLKSIGNAAKSHHTGGGIGREIHISAILLVY